MKFNFWGKKIHKIILEELKMAIIAYFLQITPRGGGGEIVVTV